MEAVADFIFLGSEITKEFHCSHEIKILLLNSLAERLMTNIESVLKSKDIT